MEFYRRLFQYDDPRSLGARLRRRRLPLLMNTIETVARDLGRRIRVVDLGGTITYWSMVPGESLTSYVSNIVLVNRVQVSADYPAPFSFLQGDACDLPELDNNKFDLVHSNSVIEHVGGWHRMRRFADEVHRLAPAHYIQTPNFWFPFEPHFGVPFFQWFPESTRARLCLRFALGHYRRCTTIDEAMKLVQRTQLLDGQQMRLLFPESHIHRERLLALTKSLIAIRVTK